MIRRRNRFHGHRSVSRVRGRVVHTALFSVRCADNKRQDYRVAVVVSKKVDKRAVVRNKIRRRIYELIRTHAELTGLPVDMVVYVKSADVASMPFEELTRQLLRTARPLVLAIQKSLK